MAKKENFFKKAFKNMVESAKLQHKVDKANFEAAKAESKASFEENRGKNTFKKAKQQAKESWENAKMSHKERQNKIKQQNLQNLKDAEERIVVANNKLNSLKKK